MQLTLLRTPDAEAIDGYPQAKKFLEALRGFCSEFEDPTLSLARLVRRSASGSNKKRF
jgi:hypothetical protein